VHSLTVAVTRAFTHPPATGTVNPRFDSSDREIARCRAAVTTPIDAATR